MSHQAMPDFCQAPRIAAVCGIVQMAVLLLFFSPVNSHQGSALEFFAACAFAQWLALSSSALLCKLAPSLSKLQLPLAFACAAVLSGMVSSTAAWLLYELDSSLKFGMLEHLSVVHFSVGTGLSMAILSALMLRYFYVRDLWQAQVQLNAKTELQALQARINPHFLFNSMNTIAALVRIDAKTAERAIEDLSDLFRAALGADKIDATFAEELHLAKQYLAIEQLRLGERLRLDWQLSNDLPLSFRMPRLLLQPLFENAVIHGVALLREGGEIQCTARKEMQYVQIEIRNPISVERQNVGSGHALQSVTHRLNLFYGARASIRTALENEIFVCELKLPYE